MLIFLENYMNSLQDKKQPSDKVPDGFTETIIYIVQRSDQPMNICVQ